MHIDETSAERASAKVYNGPENSHMLGTRLAAYDGIKLMPLGYDSRSGSWVFSVFNDQGSETAHVVVYRKGKRLPVTLEKFPSVMELGRLRQAALLDSHVYVPFTFHGKLVLHRYDLTGKLTQRRVLQVPGVYVYDFWSEERMAVARNGTVAAYTDKYLYVFDENGKVLTSIAGGAEPKISPDGRMLAYRDNEHEKVKFLDLDTMQRREITIWPQPNARLWDMLINPSHFQIDWDNQWLLFAYETNFSGPWIIYGADVSKSKVRWKRLPVVVQWWEWVVINDAPKS